MRIAARCRRWHATRASWRTSNRARRRRLGRTSARSSSSHPEGGGPKPAHQDNFYFGPTDIEGVVTAWIALDDATLENGCLYFGDGTNPGPVYAHFAPEGEPFNLQLPAAVLDRQPMAPAPVRKGGVSFHHGNTFHQSGRITARAGGGPAPCTTCATTSNSPTPPCPTTRFEAQGLVTCISTFTLGDNMTHLAPPFAPCSSAACSRPPQAAPSRNGSRRIRST